MTTHLGGALEKAIEQEHSQEERVLLQSKLSCDLDEPADGDAAQLGGEVACIVGEGQALVADALLLHPPRLHALPRPGV